MDHPQEGLLELLVPGRHPAALLELGEQPLHTVPLPVGGPVQRLGTTRLAFAGITASAPSAAHARRCAAPSNALSPTTRSTSPNRAAERSSIGFSSGASCACPGRTSTAIGSSVLKCEAVGFLGIWPGGLPGVSSR